MKGLLAIKYAEYGENEKAFEIVCNTDSIYERTWSLAEIGVLQGKGKVQLSEKSIRLLANIVKNTETENSPKK